MGKLIILPSDQGSYHGQEIIDGSTSLGENRPLSILLYKCAQARLCTQERSSFVQKKKGCGLILNHHGHRQDPSSLGRNILHTEAVWVCTGL